MSQDAIAKKPGWWGTNGGVIGALLGCLGWWFSYLFMCFAYGRLQQASTILLIGLVVSLAVGVKFGILFKFSQLKPVPMTTSFLMGAVWLEMGFGIVMLERYTGTPFEGIPEIIGQYKHGQGSFAVSSMLMGSAFLLISGIRILFMQNSIDESKPASSAPAV